ncbi:hypothetical protein LXL04_002799 [Taraxacum kok-saghyz]
MFPFASRFTRPWCQVYMGLISTDDEHADEQIRNGSRLQRKAVIWGRIGGRGSLQAEEKKTEGQAKRRRWEVSMLLEKEGRRSSGVAGCGRFLLANQEHLWKKRRGQN